MSPQKDYFSIRSLRDAFEDGALDMALEQKSKRKVTVYTAGNCCYCHMAKDLLRRKGAAFEEVDLTGRSDLRADLSARAGGRATVPQIWIGEVHVGGCDDLYDLERSGKLDCLLAQSLATHS